MSVPPSLLTQPLMNTTITSETPAAQPGEIVFYPFAYALLDEHLATHCWYCLDDQKNHRRCTGCCSAVYCDKECQLLGWKDHKYECSAIKSAKAARGSSKKGKKEKSAEGSHSPIIELPDIEVRLLGRIVARQKAILSGKDTPTADFYKDRQSERKLMDIWAHTKEIFNDPYAMRRFNDIYERLVHFYPTKALLPRDTVFEIHCRDFINRHAISDSAYMQEIGKGLYLDLCAYDHSCRPNTIYYCCGFVAHLRALHTGTNLADKATTHYSYIDLADSKQARRKLLKDTWYFHCECERCMDNSEHVLTSILCPHCPRVVSSSSSSSTPAKPPARLCLFGSWPYKEETSQLITCPQCGTQLSQAEVMEALAAMRYIGELLDGKLDDDDEGEDENKEQESGSERPRKIGTLEKKRSRLRALLVRYESLLPRVNVYYCKLIQALVPLLVPLDHHNAELLQLHLEAEECVRICYPHNHPAAGFHLRNIGIFSRNAGFLPQALRYLDEAAAIFDFTMGQEHPLTEETSRILSETSEMVEQAKKKSNPAIVTTTVDSGTGVKKKASLKKLSPRECTPLPSAAESANFDGDSGDMSGISMEKVEKSRTSNRLTAKLDQQLHI